jgi:hypothetical protein
MIGKIYSKESYKEKENEFFLSLIATTFSEMK